jgi:hypothetical protein
MSIPSWVRGEKCGQVMVFSAARQQDSAAYHLPLLQHLSLRGGWCQQQQRGEELEKRHGTLLINS